MTLRPRLLGILRFIVNHPVAPVLVVFLITLLFAVHLPQLSFHTSIYDLVIEDLPENQAYEQFKKTFGSDEIIRLVVKADNVFDPATFRKIALLADAAAHIPGVSQVVSLPDVKKAMDISGHWSLAQFRSMLAPVTFFERNILSKDYRSTAITLVLKDGVPREEVIAATQKLIDTAPRDLTLYQIGLPLAVPGSDGQQHQGFFHAPAS